VPGKARNGNTFQRFAISDIPFEEEKEGAREQQKQLTCEAKVTDFGPLDFQRSVPVSAN
jgi:hypothetical protein